MTATPTTLGVVVQMTPTTYVRPAVALWPGVSSGSLELVGDVGGTAGLSLTFDGVAALQRLLDAGQVLLGQMLREQRQAEEADAWAARTAALGRPPLHAVRPDETARRQHPSYAGSPA